jgi:hypothetical protein
MRNLIKNKMGDGKPEGLLREGWQDQWRRQRIEGVSRD